MSVTAETRNNTPRFVAVTPLDCDECGARLPVEAPFVRRRVAWIARLSRTENVCTEHVSEIVLLTADRIACDGCGRPFLDSSGEARPRQERGAHAYCSGACAEASRNRRRRLRQLACRPLRACATCGVELGHEVRTDARYCSAACRQRGYRARRRS